MLSVKKIREAKGLSIRQLSEKSRLTERAIKYYEKGERDPGTSSILALCKGPECSPNDLLGWPCTSLLRHPEE